MVTDQLINKLQLSLGLVKLPEFMGDTIWLLNYTDICGCAISIETLYNQDVPVQDIDGIAQSPFKTWIDFLQSEARWDRDKFDAILQLARTNPEYYDSGCDKDGWSFTCLNGRYYTLDGHHRTVIVKLMAAAGTVKIVRNVTVTYINYDPKLLELTTHVQAMFRCFGKISIEKQQTIHFFSLKPKFKFCLPLNAEVDSFRDLTYTKVVWIFLHLLWHSCLSRAKITASR